MATLSLDPPGPRLFVIPAASILTFPDVWSRNARQEEKLCACPRKHIGKPKEIAIFLTKDTTSPALLATVQPYTSNDDPDETVNPSKADFPRDHVPSYETLQGWVEGQIRREQKPAFAQTLQSFLLAYSEGGRGLPKVRSLKSAFGRRSPFG